MNQIKRKLLFGERMLYGDGTSPFNMVIPFKIKGEISENILKSALLNIQKKHPWLAATIEIDERKKPWFTTRSAALLKVPVRLVERLNDTAWKEESEREWHMPFDATISPLFRVTWIKGLVYSEFLLVFHHCLCDGTTGLSILKELLLLLDHPDANIGTEIPIQDIKDIVPAKVLGNYRKRTKNALIGKMATLVLWMMPIKKVAIDRKRDFLIHWKLKEKLTSQILFFCKANEFTVNTLLSAIVLKAFHEVRAEKSFNKISLPVDIRNLNPLIKKDHVFAFGLMIVLSAEKTDHFIDGVKQLQKKVDQKLAKLDPYALMMMMEVCHPALHHFSKLLKYGKTSNDCMFSNLGKLDFPDEYENFELVTIYSPSVIGPLGNTTTMLTSTFRKQMDFSFVASEGYLPFKDAQLIQEKVIALLEECVKI
ncbi:hypothetical protein G6M26_01970 [Agrobacterium tumefaciens]|nr:hypothetical protein [Agrobacterium tumefaciens]NTE17278.1 hypothetical protein [Agrobacterium tumefaciens]